MAGDIHMILYPGFTFVEGLAQTIGAAGVAIVSRPDGWYVSDLPAAQAIVSSYTGSATELAYHRLLKQTALDAAFDANFDLAKFIRGGTVTGVTAVQVGAFLAQITNNYRTLRASIAAATMVAICDAINVNSGWPSNP